MLRDHIFKVRCLPFLINGRQYLIGKLINNNFSSLLFSSLPNFNQQFDEVSKASLGFFIARGVVNVIFVLVVSFPQSHFTTFF